MAETANQRRRRRASHESFLRHRSFRYLKLAIVVSAISILTYVFHDPLPRANGGTWLGYTLGTMSALLIFWLTALGMRKRAITPGFWSLKGWTSAHVYLGLALLVLGTLHTGFQFGWNVHTYAYVAMVVVILSGVVGVYFYADIPKRMAPNREQRTAEQMIQELNAIDRRLTEQSQPLPADLAATVSASINRTRVAGGVMERLRGGVRRDPTRIALRKLRARHPQLDGAARETLSTVIDTLQRKAESLARARRHIRYKALLEVWLYVHVPVTFLLLALLTAHVFSVFFYW